jgi:methylated-DNA-protein-cysteine methyltransferase related protein
VVEDGPPRSLRPPSAAARRIVAVLMAVGEGEVVSYGDVAEVAGLPGRARLVGQVLAATAVDVPWWRVVTATGRLVPGHESEQASLLRAEGVEVRAGRVAWAPVGRFNRRQAPLDPSSP